MKNFVTPSLSVFKSDAAVMLREFREGCPVAVKRLSHTKSFKRGNVRLGTCLRVIASEYYLQEYRCRRADDLQLHQALLRSGILEPTL